MRSSRIAMACLAILVAVFACDDQPGAERLQGVDASMAAGGPTPPECDTKSLPTRDYFQDKDDVRLASSLLRDLSDACASLDQAGAYDIGFGLLGMVETARAAAVASDAVAYAGGQLVWGIWTAMEYTHPAGPICDGCTRGGPTAQAAYQALAPGGAFGVRSSGDTDAVYSMGDPTAVRWGVEPDGDDWSVLPAGRALIYGYPSASPVNGDLPLGGGFDWSVTPWYDTPSLENYLLVGNCAETGLYLPFIAHETSLLTSGKSPSYCNAVESTLAEDFGTRVVQMASSLLPFWPQELYAVAGGGAAGNAREFSPFYGWDIPADASTDISQAYGDPTPEGEPICFESLDPSVPTDCTSSHIFTVDWSTYGGSDIATAETFRVFTRDNNGATVDFTNLPTVIGAEGTQCSYDPNVPNEIICECDGREGIGDCTRLALNGLALNKPGVYQLCVENNVENPKFEGLESGLNIAACTENFHISPNP